MTEPFKVRYGTDEYFDVVRTTCREWYDGGTSAMRELFMDETISRPRKLLREARQTQKACVLDEWKAPLKRLVEFAERHNEMINALKRARRACLAAHLAGATGMEIADATQCYRMDAEELEQ